MNHFTAQNADYTEDNHDSIVIIFSILGNVWKLLVHQEEQE